MKLLRSFFSGLGLGLSLLASAPAFSQTLDETFKSTDWVAENKDNPGVVLVDVRAPSEYASGHIPGAINIPATSFYFTK